MLKVCDTRYTSSHNHAVVTTVYTVTVTNTHHMAWGLNIAPALIKQKTKQEGGGF